jgi:hypothetical protein
VPVFPLPSFVLFPLATVPLHIFELRYRAMVRDALRSDRLIATALLKPGWENDYHGSPAFHATGCLARVEEAHWRPDDCYDLKVVGLSRVRLGAISREYPYRSAAVTPLPQDPLSDDDPLVELERRAVLAAYQRLQGGGEPRSGSDPLPGLEQLVNTVCTKLAIAPEEKLELLELDSVLERSRRLRERIERDLRQPSPPPEGGERN